MEPGRDVRELNAFIDKYGMKYFYNKSAREEPDKIDMDTIRRDAEILATKRLKKKVISRRPNYSVPKLEMSQASPTSSCKIDA